MPKYVKYPLASISPLPKEERERVAKRDKEWGNDGGDATNPSLHSVVPPSLF